MNRRRTPSMDPGGLRPQAALPSLESRLDELQQQLDHLTREAHEMRRLIDARKAKTNASSTRRSPDGSRDRES